MDRPWAERLRGSSFSLQAAESALTDVEELETLAHGWRDWARAPGGWFALLHGEVLARA